MGIKIYMVDSNYITYLRSFDTNVALNKKIHEGIRKYTGIVFEVNDFKYFAPMSSPKQKHKNISDEQIDCVKIKKGQLGVVNLNNMIPVCDENLLPFHINEQEESYKNLLFNQFKYLNKSKQEVKDKARKLYSIVNSGKHKKISNRCCNFKLLEQKCMEYQYVKESFDEAAVNITTYKE
ncbi:type III toxin-antitoxin system ToxN/AbiQ family toxin (plasmid) [Clostridium botulinum]|uniref:type III toxin-antitoxin system ToxN/AbiQ family toxin n=1 Tax=Clostridium botulinum TaxID=1491 RepID=UPI0004D83DDB|nr:type III toxin-antitoxin system ToxN/AbiQ family toxin [Clostridium botulinum]KEH96562.1 hypothetical protein Z953_p0140 [Clostridium botulinum D str. 16868]MCD3232686.1 type III toxin-antitoxin system ToxN/AbiQ family toxin [Clostridium botulinum D/C]MCD3313084.1 type III toxin-antitoxin system ToxN/AbiQ family toxin [Clostridium botulinum D/C]MCD3318396.1 type III toxin-antitoxin system ToxN/AbiQ family toxin [Clostridium botulinum D/C]QPW59074.1 type III toxin-antitoxin system ToxN/AbiQ 